MGRNCEIVEVGKRRDGGTRYWCLTHRANATAKYGKPLDRCVAANDPEITRKETLHLDPNLYKGGIGLWGAVPAIYDTTQHPIDRGIHVHARTDESAPKVMDHTYRAVSLKAQRDLLEGQELVVGELDAIYFMASSVFRKPMKYVVCTLCGHPHLDKDWFALHKHRKHLCSGCGRQFADHEEGIGNPAIRLRDAFEGGKPRKLVGPKRKLKLRQRDYPGGIQIWGSNPAIVWTAKKVEEEGIHVHAFKNNDGSYSIDNTYSSVEIDGIVLDAEMVRVYMAQAVLPHLAGRIAALTCPNCAKPHFDTSDLAFTPHKEHHCNHCKAVFGSNQRVRLTIGNPIVTVIAELAQHAVRPPRSINLGLRPETL